MNRLQRRMVEGRYNPFRSPRRAMGFGGILGFGMGYAGGEFVNWASDLDPEISPLITGAIGAVALGSTYRKIVREYPSEINRNPK